MYTITRKCLSGIDLVGYELRDDIGNVKTFRIEDVLRLAEQGHIEEYSVVEYNNEKHLYSERYSTSRLDMVESINKLDIKSKLVRDGVIVGYVVTDGKRTYNITTDKLWSLAVQGGINGVKAEFIGDTRVIKYTDQRLYSL